MSEKSDTFKLVNAVELTKEARVGMELTYFDVVALIDDLREENANLAARIAELEEKQRWRVVANGELPKIGIPVLFLADWGSIYEGCTYDGKTIALYDLEDYEDSDITHWMPLPGLPEVQE